ncbi:ABC transporter permease [Macrococcus capreoli]|uniref:ABC transporter permease n=1 Tax=Macrococcus capreoli TaxID=2982690 RepID=UPI0021D60653|nr:ABC transporter permease [Macrococcus sp. TMW 2.2395]MCU7558627.1 ABC transporter permease [Macrococcus sp. TMW 2.2395]
MSFKSVMYYFQLEIIRFLREPISIFFTLIFPVVLIYVFGDSFGSATNQNTNDNYYNSLVPIDISFLIANMTLMGIGNDLAAQKERGISESQKLLPINYWTRFVIESISYLCLLFLSIIIITIFVYMKYPNIEFKGNIFIYILIILLSYFTFVSIVRFIVSLNYSARTLQLISSSIFFMLLFTSGIVIPKESLPEMLKNIVYYSPTYIIFDVLDLIWNGKLNLIRFLQATSYFIFTILLFNILNKLMSMRNK